jgi:hypothetical protein
MHLKAWTLRELGRRDAAAAVLQELIANFQETEDERLRLFVDAACEARADLLDGSS